MNDRTLRLLAAMVLCGAAFAVNTASAQMNPDEGGVWVPPPDDPHSQVTPQPPSPVQPQPPPPERNTATPPRGQQT
ncbi:MAG: hypothetical protein AB8I08_29135, partial [Sandaracinaceae bacterium]